MMFVLVATAVGPLFTIETSAAAAATAMLQLLVAATDAKSRTLALKGKVPAEVGVPMSSPVAAARLRPGGSDPVTENV
jgi:Na+/H+ antiporter NhaD/arsenite permease-like protein